jgi:hypothetical protein
LLCEVFTCESIGAKYYLIYGYDVLIFNL